MATVKTLDEARKRRVILDICYLCGQTVDKNGSLAEHVLPKTILGRPSSPSAWPIILDVHHECERDCKRGGDALVSLWQKLFLSPENLVARATEGWDQVLDGAYDDNAATLGGTGPRLSAAAARLAAGVASPDVVAVGRALFEYIDTVSILGGVSRSQKSAIESRVAALFDRKRLLTSGHYARSPIKLLQGCSTTEGTAIEGIASVFNAIWTWIRGLHAFCYAQFLHPNAQHAVYTTLDVFAGTTSPRSLDSLERHGALRALLLTADEKEIDGATFWNGECEYRTAWVLSRPGVARCVWWIRVPGPEDAREFSGWYDKESPPCGRSILTDSHFAEANARKLDS